MNGLMHSWARIAILLAWMLSGTVEAQQHRATRLGHPTTRFATPLETPDDLRERFQNPKLKPDFTIVLRQVNWPGDPEDMHRAAATAEIAEIEIPVGSVMPFMSSRENGRPIALREVLWAGDKPAPAYAFFFASRGRRYRCVTPKACSNFFVEDLGPEPPRIEVKKTASAETGLCDPIEMRITVRNSGSVPVTGVRIQDTFPAGFHLRDGRTSVDMEAGSLQPGEGRELKFLVFAGSAGTFTNEGRVTTSEGVVGTATATTRVLAPALVLECLAPHFVFLGRPIDVCLSVTNTGDSTEAKATVTLPLPPGAVLASTTAGGTLSGDVITWELPPIAPGGVEKVCAQLAPQREIGSFTFAGSVRGTCAPLAASSCTTEIRGVPGILLEVVDATDPVQVGEEITYIIRATNQGSSGVTNLRLTCLLPPAQEFVSASGATKALPENRTIHFEPLPLLSSKDQSTWTVVTRALNQADARFRTELISDQFDRPILEIESTHQY